MKIFTTTQFARTLAIVTMFASSCTKNVNDHLLPEKSKPIASDSAITITGQTFGCWYTSQISVGKITNIQNSYIWAVQNYDGPISQNPSEIGNYRLFGSNIVPFHSNPASKKVSDIKDWIISAITELGGSNPANGQWDCNIDSVNPNQINITIYNNGSGCANLETIFPNYGVDICLGVKTAVFISFDLASN